MADHKQFPIPENVRICCISLNSTDCIRLIGVPEQLYVALRSAINNSWGEIQYERPYHGSHQFKLRGHPWIGQMDEAVKSRSLLVALLTSMAQNGWNFLQAADTSKKVHDKDSLYFEYFKADPEVKMFGLSFNRGDRIRLIDAPEEMKDVLTGAVAAHVRIQKQRDYYGSFELKLAGNPWYYDGAEGVTSRKLLCQIIANFRSLGYKLYASVDISYGPVGRGGMHGGVVLGDLESWVFRRVSPPFWQ